MTRNLSSCKWAGLSPSTVSTDDPGDTDDGGSITMKGQNGMHYEVKHYRNSDKSSVHYAVDTPADVLATLKHLSPSFKTVPQERIDKICRFVRGRRPYDYLIIFESLTTKFSVCCVYGLKPSRFSVLVWNAGNETENCDDVYRDVQGYCMPMLRNALEVIAPHLKNELWTCPAPPAAVWEVGNPKIGRALVQYQEQLG